MKENYFSFCISNGIFVANSCKYQSFKGGSFIAVYHYDKFMIE